MNSDASLQKKILELEQQLRRSEAQAAQAEAQVAQEQQARQKAEAQAAEAEAQAAQEQQARQKAEAQAALSTLSEYLELCHRHLFEPISIQTNKSLTTQGGPTSVKGKLRPVKIRPWRTFLDKQKDVFDRLFEHYSLNSGPRVFDSALVVARLKRKIQQPIASELDLRIIQNLAIEDPVKDILQHLATIDAVRDEFHLPKSIRFDNHINALSSEAEEVAERLASQTLDPSTPVMPRPGRRALLPDQICVYFLDDDEQPQGLPAFVVEYKAPHKVTTAMLREGLHEMNVDEVINAVHMPHHSEEKELFRYHAERLVAAVLTQTFSYMMHAGTLMGYMTIGEAIVFLRVSLDDASTLEYHLAEPQLDVSMQKSASADEFIHRTAVSQIVAFSLAALESPAVSQEWQQRAIDSLPLWEVDYTAILAAIPETIRRSPPTSNYIPRMVLLTSPRGGLLQLRSGRVIGGCGSPLHGKGHETSDSDDEGDKPPYQTPTRRSARLAKQSSGIQPPSSGQRGRPKYQPGDRSRERKFCTSSCLLGLKQGSKIDKQCPNIQAHLAGEGPANYHRLSAEMFLHLLGEQLTRTLDSGIGPMGLQGVRGALFWVTLDSHGYKLVAKGTREVYCPELDHEHAVYQRLGPLQGLGVPVCLGRVDLVRPYRFCTVPFQHWLLLSWGGLSLYNPTAIQQMRCEGHDCKYWEDLLTRILNAIRQRGVVHGDVRGPNVVWDSNAKRLYLIDFEGSQLLPVQKSRVLCTISSNVSRRQTASLKQSARRKLSFSSQNAALATSLIKELNL
jgi:hypothetical protein